MERLLTSINYSFSESFRVSAKQAYRWCTSYDPNDLKLMHENGRRKIKQRSKDAFILIDNFKKENRTISKTKLVRLYPREMSWTNTYLSGPERYSQFLYKIVSEGKNKSRLDFVGLQLEPKDMTDKEAAAFARSVRRKDSHSWKLLAKAMEQELLK